MFSYISKLKSLLLLVAVVTLLPLQVFAANDTKDPVENTSNNIISNSFGNCVRTKWDVGVNKCKYKGDIPKRYGKPKQKSRSYLVFFDFDRSVVTSNSKDILRQLQKDARSNKARLYELTGHADRAGTNLYNMGLSKKRANAVKAFLSSLGASSSTIDIYAKGESTPLIPTADGVREPQNRRVEIIFYYD